MDLLFFLFYSLRLIFLIVYHLNKHWLGPYFSTNTNAFADKRVHLWPIDFYCFTEMKSKLFLWLVFFLSLSLKDEAREKIGKNQVTSFKYNTCICLALLRQLKLKEAYIIQKLYVLSSLSMKSDSLFMIETVAYHVMFSLLI